MIRVSVEMSKNFSDTLDIYTENVYNKTIEKQRRVHCTGLQHPHFHSEWSVYHEHF